MMEACGSPECSWKCSVGKLIPERALRKEDMCLCRQQADGGIHTCFRRGDFSR